MEGQRTVYWCCKLVGFQFPQFSDNSRKENDDINEIKRRIIHPFFTCYRMLRLLRALIICGTGRPNRPVHKSNASVLPN